MDFLSSRCAWSYRNRKFSHQHYIDNNRPANFPSHCGVRPSRISWPSQDFNLAIESKIVLVNNLDLNPTRLNEKRLILREKARISALASFMELKA